MKTITEFKEWCRGAAEEFEDPAMVIGQLFLRHVDTAWQQPDELVVRWSPQESQLMFDVHGFFKVPMWLPIVEDEPKITPAGELEAFAIRQVCPGFWSMLPSLNIPGAFHVFVNIYDVPDPAPWEKRILVLTGGNHRGVLTRILEKTHG